MAQWVKKSSCNARDARDLGSSPGLGRPPQEEGYGNPLQYSCLENPWTEEPGLAGYSPWDGKESDTADATYHGHKNYRILIQYL